MPQKKLYKKRCNNKLKKQKSNVSRKLPRGNVKKLKRPLLKQKEKKRRLSKPFLLHKRPKKK